MATGNALNGTVVLSDRHRHNYGTFVHSDLRAEYLADEQAVSSTRRYAQWAALAPTRLANPHCGDDLPLEQMPC